MNKLVKTVSCTGMAVILAAAGLSGCGNTLDGTKKIYGDWSKIKIIKVKK